VRHDISFKVICGESADVKEIDCLEWTNNVLTGLLENYSEENIFNDDETGLFHKCTPDKSMAFKSESCQGGKRSKDRVTVIIGSNMNGSEKLPLLLIGKSKNPRCFRNVNLHNFYLKYEHNKIA